MQILVFFSISSTVAHIYQVESMSSEDKLFCSEKNWLYISQLYVTTGVKLRNPGIFLCFGVADCGVGLWPCNLERSPASFKAKLGGGKAGCMLGTTSYMQGQS